MSKLTRLSKGVDCIRCHGPHAYSCHYNGVRQQAFGKGRSIKCHDLVTAEFCHTCDQMFSEGVSNDMWANKWERSEEFLYWVMMTNIRRFNNEIIKVK